MKSSGRLSIGLTAAFFAVCAQGATILHFPLDLKIGGLVEETVSGKKLPVNGSRALENIPGAMGNALRFDGYSNFVKGKIIPGSQLEQATFSVWVAPETYPVVEIDMPTDERILIAGTISTEDRKGWGFTLGYTGKYAFECYSGGWKVEILADDLLPVYEWSHLAAVCDAKSGQARLYRNGLLVGEGRTMAIDNSSDTFYIGKSDTDSKTGPFFIKTFNGLIDDIEVQDNILSENELKSFKPENKADLTIPSSRFADQKLRPAFHGMPGANWTNECHGMLYSGGKYHIFFQKNANGPYMTRLHWGHLSSPNLYDWTEEKIALMPETPYDIKGCWSGCVFTDNIVGNGSPTAIYTAVDYAKAVIASAQAKNDDLIEWEKNPSNPIINGRPSGLSDDFRDPYFFRNGDKAYIIVGSSKNGVGTATLHEYNTKTGLWSNDGRIFFSGTNSEECGQFWEMPNVTKMENGKWLFTCTPLNTAEGVRTLYWTGDIGADGTFVPDKYSEKPRFVELIGKEGFGLLSPTVYNHDGKTLAMGIVPDKLSAMTNYTLGWAHTYSLPREWSINTDGSLCQKPYAGLENLRTSKHETITDYSLDGSKTITSVSGTRVEAKGTFVIGSSPFGFRLLKNASGYAEISYNPGGNMLTVDLTKLSKYTNDSHVFDGLYQCTLPERPSAGSELVIDVWLDGSILDIFINNRWATSIRVFPTDDDAEEVEIYSAGPTEIVKADFWVLETDANGSGIREISSSTTVEESVYDLQGIRASKETEGRIFISQGKKYLKR